MKSVPAGGRAPPRADYLGCEEWRRARPRAARSRLSQRAGDNTG